MVIQQTVNNSDTAIKQVAYLLTSGGGDVWTNLSVFPGTYWTFVLTGLYT